MPEPAQLAQDERAALAFRQGVEVRVQCAPFLALHDHNVDARLHRRRVAESDRRTAPAEDRDRLVVRDAEQPRPHVDLTLLALQRCERALHRALQRVLRVLIVAEIRRQYR